MVKHMTECSWVQMSSISFIFSSCTFQYFVFAFSLIKWLSLEGLKELSRSAWSMSLTVWRHGVVSSLSLILLLFFFASFCLSALLSVLRPRRPPWLPPQFLLSFSSVSMVTGTEGCEQRLRLFTCCTRLIRAHSCLASVTSRPSDAGWVQPEERERSLL